MCSSKNTRNTGRVFWSRDVSRYCCSTPVRLSGVSWASLAANHRLTQTSLADVILHLMTSCVASS